MKVSNRILAQALYMAAAQNPAKIKPLIRNFFVYLRAKRRLRASPTIARELEGVAAQQGAIVQAAVITPLPLPAPAWRKIEALVKQRTGAKAVTLRQTIEPSLVGGAQIRFGDHLIDMSVKTQLSQLVE